MLAFRHEARKMHLYFRRGKTVGKAMKAVRRRSDRVWTLAALLIGTPAGASAATEPPSFPVEPTQLAKAEALRTLPCLSASVEGSLPIVEGFTLEPGVEPVWRMAGTIIAVRRAGDDRFAFVLKSPRAGSNDCRVQQVVVLPRQGVIMQCGLPDASSKGMGVHARSASGRRGTVYWEAEPSGTLVRSPEVDIDNLICALPE